MTDEKFKLCRKCAKPMTRYDLPGRSGWRCEHCEREKWEEENRPEAKTNNDEER